MMPKFLWLSLLTSAVVLPASGCGEVEHCTEAITRGCLNSPPRDDGSCLYDLVRRGNLCVKAGSIEDTCSFCPAGTLCVPDQGKCVNFCEAPAVLPGSGTSPEAIFCRAFLDPQMPGANPMLAFEEVCRRRCRLECQHKEQYCGQGCAQGSCDLPMVQTQCLKECPPLSTGGKDVACLTKACEDVRLAHCDSTLKCPNARIVNCTDITCTNDCSYGTNSQCDDGDPISSKSAACAWGSDCAECGPRKGPKPSAALGGICLYHDNCAGGTGKPSTATAWCVLSESQRDLRHCVPDCSRNQDCEAGFECREVVFEPAGMTGGLKQPIVEDGRKSQACLPTQCI